MILVTVGSGYQVFTRMLWAMDDVAGQINERVLMQVGHTPLVPRHTECFKFVPYEKMQRYLRAASVIVCHASTGPLSSARRLKKPVVVVPRNPELGEARDTHQLETAVRIKGTSRMIEVVNDTDRLLDAVQRALQKSAQNITYEQDNEFKMLIKNLRAYVGDFEKRSR
jgi:beta-1,4-N-acetylglucosaminyltransferase